MVTTSHFSESTALLALERKDSNKKKPSSLLITVNYICHKSIACHGPLDSSFRSLRGSLKHSHFNYRYHPFNLGMALCLAVYSRSLSLVLR